MLKAKCLFQAVFLGCILSLTACATPGGVYSEVGLGSKAADVLEKYGAPEKVQKVLKYEVWSYNIENSQQCQLFFEKQALSQPVKCFAQVERHLASRGIASERH
jgi:hypothetical protein